MLSLTDMSAIHEPNIIIIINSFIILILWTLLIILFCTILTYLDEYLGSKLFSYGQELSFKLRLGSDDVSLSVEDLVLEGGGRQISAPLVAQGNPRPGVYPQKYTFK